MRFPYSAILIKSFPIQRSRKKLIVGLRWKGPANGSGGIRVNISPSPKGICIVQVHKEDAVHGNRLGKEVAFEVKLLVRLFLNVITEMHI